MVRFIAAIVAGSCGLFLWPATGSCAAPGSGTTRVDVRFTESTIRNVGGNTSVSTFSGYSYGLGSLDQRYGGGGAGALRSSIDQGNSMSMTRGDPAQPPTGMFGDISPGAMTIDRTRTSMGVRPSLPVGSGLDLHTGAPLAGTFVAPVAPIGRSVKGDGAGLDAAGGIWGSDGMGLGRALAAQDDTAFGAARAYVQALAAASTSLLKDRTEPITTLVPTPPSPYRDYMSKGDLAFRTNNFQEAFANFEIANDLGGKDPESFICMAHTQFALSKHSYAKASYLLQQALKYMPELALANLRPRGFYGSLNKYAEHLVALQEHVEKSPDDGEALLVLAYFRWFGETQDVQATRKALSAALAGAVAGQDSRLIEATETFWDGMVASGKVSGKLVPAGEGGSATQPAAPRSVPSAVPPTGAAARPPTPAKP